MKRQHGKQRLFEVVARLDKTFKPTLNESPMFGGQNVSQEMYDELQYDKSTMEKAMGDAFATPPDYQMKHPVKGGETIQLEDGDKVQVKSVTDGFIQVKVFPVEGKPFNISWSPKQFDAIVGNAQNIDEYGGFGTPEWEDPSNPDREHDRFIHKKYVQNKEPRIITLKYPAVCKETGKRMKPGEQALYYPNDKSFFCLDSKQAQEYREMKADDQMGGVYENELSEIVSEYNELEADEDNQPKTEEEQFEELVETYINGNITFFVHGLKGMEVGEVVRFLRWAQANNVKF